MCYVQCVFSTARLAPAGYRTRRLSEVSAHRSSAQSLVSCHYKSFLLLETQRAQQLEMQPLTNTLSNNCLIDRPLSSHSPGLRWMDLGVSVSPGGQMPLYLPPYSHFLQRCLRSNVKVNELTRLCYRMCSLGHFLLLVCYYNLISPTLHHTHTPLTSPPNPSPPLTPLWFPGGLGSFARL